MGRYRVVESTPSGWGREFSASRLSVVRDIVYALGGEWRVQRQWKWPGGRWHTDRGRNADFMLSFTSSGEPTP